MPAPSSDARFRAVFDAHHEAVHRYCLRRLEVNDANDAVAEVFMVAWRRLDEMPSGGSVLPWLYGVARNAVRNQHRALRRRARLTARLGTMSHPPSDDPDAQLIRHDDISEVHRALDVLRETEREIVRLKVWEELTNEQIGQVLGISDRAVEGRYARALRKLGGRIEPRRAPSGRLNEEGSGA